MPALQKTGGQAAVLSNHPARPPSIECGRRLNSRFPFADWVHTEAPASPGGGGGGSVEKHVREDCRTDGSTSASCQFGASPYYLNGTGRERRFLNWL